MVFNMGIFIITQQNCLYYFSRRKNIGKLVLKIGTHILEIVKEVKFLGIIFDSKLTLLKHIQYIHTKCIKVLNCMRLLIGTKWGANSHTLRTMYFALIRSKIYYGCEVYNSASHTVTQLLDSIQLQSLRMCTGSMKSASRASLQVEMGDPPYEERRKSLLGKSYLNIISFDHSHPTKITLQDDVMFRFYDTIV